jgi:hypothetical protein
MLKNSLRPGYFFFIILKALVCVDIQTSYNLKQKLGMF